MTSLFRFPKPRSLLHFVSLRTASEFITFTLLINKVTGFYGILALFTGYELNALQLTHYVYSVIVLVLGIYLMPSIRNPSRPLHNLALAWLYVLDTLVNAAYTALFGTAWFMVLSQHLQEPGKDSPIGGGAAGSGTIDDTAGFTSPEINATSVEITVKPAPGLLPGQQADAVAISQPGSLAGAVLESDMMTSIALLAMFSLIRVYFCIIVMSYARGILRQYVASTSASSAGFSESTSTDPTMAESPFTAGRVEGQGWKGALGRVMVKFPTKRYWLGREEFDGQSDWERATSGRFESGRQALKVKVPNQEVGVGERERRARSGTGPPPPLAPGSLGKKIPE
ncbi:unnamed protein product [Zymoseptoria tritici ST99CH_1A5]|uniref:DUF1753 domain-containing protein n=4 Tax=Zymoseptoria tritici TaxID=1047171 RepID=A0A1X7S394_ZYMT9|nr:unnamed protein product [Zymoseptoria tritici ST99CH_3D7]SMR58575.1 unnamed protein product [Zymoseptoria tritici ST99CH_1E4]SMR61568.1 unnamed protein product [Zymoseptoria tritici ST99CH_3D1]SMY27780.1 unnamed protein product [Zymoseptoria tritici ST99CH_1A5]